MFIKYLRGTENRHPFGCVVGIDKDHTGYSLCAPCDRFEKKRARQIAAGRATCGNSLVDVAKRLKTMTGCPSYGEALSIAEHRFPRLYAVAETLRDAETYFISQ